MEKCKAVNWKAHRSLLKKVVLPNKVTKRKKREPRREKGKADKVKFKATKSRESRKPTV